MPSSRSKTRRKQGRRTSPERGDDPRRPQFLPRVLDRTVIAVPLLDQLTAERKAGKARKVFDIVIDLNLDFRGGRANAFRRTAELLEQIVRDLKRPRTRQGMIPKTEEDMQYVFASLDGDAIRELVRRDGSSASRTDRAIHRIWPDFPLRRLIYDSIRTVKADAAHNSFGAFGERIVWAVVDSGIDGTHPHFLTHRTLELDPPLAHRDFTSANPGDPLRDAYGHGTHVAGIISGEMKGDGIVATTQHLDENGDPTEVTVPLESISGMAPRCKILSLKVLDQDGRGNGTGKASSIISAIQYIQRLNGYGRRILVHGVNLSVGYDFEPEWFACGQSPLCVEVDRLVKSGVVVVVAAGNSGYGFAQSKYQGQVTAGLDLTINDPGNAELAITVGSTHRDMPHVYGVSYFSSKGPTGDGRMKPDLLAPGEKIVSCDSAQRPGAPRARGRGNAPVPAAGGRYREDSGTSMAAPHVSGVIAAFMSIRREFIRRPEEVKRIFLTAATDLGRAPYFQGRGLVDLMRAIQSI